MKIEVVIKCSNKWFKEDEAVEAISRVLRGIGTKDQVWHISGGGRYKLSMPPGASGYVKVTDTKTLSK